jgi:soluble lytic murein transglycosylase-like protein
MTYVPAPSYPNYASFLSNMLGDLPARSNQAQQQQIQLQQERQQQAQQQALTQAFQSGLPMKDGQIDWPAVTQNLAKGGDWRDAVNLAPQIQQQQRFIQNQSDTQTEIDDAGREQGTLPPASVAASRPSTPVTPASTGQPSDRAPQQAPAGPSPLFVGVGKRYGVSPDYLARTAKIESNDNPNATNPSGATGEFQFTPATAKQYGVNPKDLFSSTVGAAKLAADNKAQLTQALGRPPTDAELYLAHQQGAAGAAKLLANPDAKASDIVGMKAVIQNGGKPNMTAGQFAQMWIGKYNATGGGTSNFGPSGGIQGGPGVAMPATAAPPGPITNSVLPQITPQAPVAGGLGAMPAAQPMMPQGGPAAPPTMAPNAPGFPQPELPINPFSKQPFKDPQQAVRYLRALAAKAENLGNKGLADERREWANNIEKRTAPIKLGANDTLFDPLTRQPIYQGNRAGGGPVAQQIAKAIANGDQPPVLTGLYGQSAAVRAELEAKGVDLTGRQLEWTRAQKQIQSLNGPQMTRFVGLAGSVNNTIDEVRKLSDKMQLSGVPLLNRAKLQSYIQAAGNSANGQLASQYLAAVNTLKEEFANLANGGYAPQEAAWKLADSQINGDYGVKQLGASLDEVQRLIKYRLQAMPGMSAYGPGADNPYLPGGGSTPEGAGGQSAPTSAPPAQGASSGRPIAVNPSTGQKLMLSDDGKSWVPAK